MNYLPACAMLLIRPWVYGKKEFDDALFLRVTFQRCMLVPHLPVRLVTE
jgi:hypothetical protein